MSTRVLFPCFLLAALVVGPYAHAEDDAAWEAYFASMGADDVPAALDDPEFDQPATEAAPASGEPAGDEAEAREEDTAKKSKKRSRRSRRSEKAEDEALVEAGTSATVDAAAEEEDAAAAAELLPVEGPEAVGEVLSLLGAASSPAADGEPLALFDQAESSENTFPWGRWIAINFCLALMLGGAVYGVKKGKLAHWLKKARLPHRQARIAPDLDVVATHNLSHGQAIHLIEGDDFRLVIGSWPGGMTQLATLPRGSTVVREVEDGESPVEIPLGAGMTEDDEAETDVMVALPELNGVEDASAEVALASDQAEVRIDVGTYDSWFDDEASADEATADGDGPITVDDGDAPKVKELRFPDALRRAAAYAAGRRARAEDGVRVPATPVERKTSAADLPTEPPRSVGVFQTGGGAEIPSNPDHEILAEQVLAQVRELRGAR